MAKNGRVLFRVSKVCRTQGILLRLCNDTYLSIWGFLSADQIRKLPVQDQML